MPESHTWRMSHTTAREYRQLAAQLSNYDITEEEFTERMMSLPGYPLNRPPRPGEHLRIVVLRTLYSSGGPDHGSRQQRPH